MTARPSKLSLCCLLLQLGEVLGIAEVQSAWQAPMSSVEIGSTWEAIGPFPSGTREHPFMASPIYAYLNHSSPSMADRQLATMSYHAKSWPSHLADGGRIAPRNFSRNEDGWVEIVYEDIRWDWLRASEGWSALQHQVLLRTSLNITSPSIEVPVPLLIELIQGTEFALVPLSTDREDEQIIWYNGDVYAYGDTIGSELNVTRQTFTSPFAHAISVLSGQYVLLLRAMYEIRMFGDPGVGNPPVIKLKLDAEITNSDSKRPIEVVPELGLVGDVVDGWLAGVVLGVGLKASHGIALGLGKFVLEKVALDDGLAPNQFSLEMVTTRFYLLDGQTRVLPLKIIQQNPLQVSQRTLGLLLSFKGVLGETYEVSVTFTLRHLKHWTDEPSPGAIKFTHLSPTHSPTFGMLLPPTSLLPNSHFQALPTILALHGAGVSASARFWCDGIPRRATGWAILPTGMTEWGQDWHGASMESVFAARGAGWGVVEWLNGKIGGKGDWPISRETILMGHSNGGQGAWHLAARYPDEFLGGEEKSAFRKLSVANEVLGSVIPAAGYLKIQDYVAYSSWTGAHYADPALTGILSAALAPYNNDLYASNLAHVPVLAVHGAVDGNVPPQHSRIHVGLVNSWTANLTAARLEEISGKDHWWPEVLHLDHVKAFIAELSKAGGSTKSRRNQYETGFTFTTANPDESGSKGGIRISELEIPGRLGRIEVIPRKLSRADKPYTLRIKLTNVRKIRISAKMASTFNTLQLLVKGRYIEIEMPVNDQNSELEIDVRDHTLGPDQELPRAYGPMSRILSSKAPLVLVVGSIKSDHAAGLTGVARRLAHDALLYQRLDSEIVDDITALKLVVSGELGDGNIVVIGGPALNLFADWLLRSSPVPVSFVAPSVFTIGDGLFYENGTGTIFLHPHPTSQKGLVCFIAGTDFEGTLLAERLFPIRTGVPVPDWAVIGLKSRWQGTGGILGAGFWGSGWDWEPSMSFL